MWILLALICAFAQALWAALSKRQLQILSPLRFMLFLRLPILAVFLPAFIWRSHPEVPTRFWIVALSAAACECIRLVAFAQGTRRDYYATYSLFSTSPLFVLLLAPHLVGEKPTPAVVAGVVSVVIGGLIFYRAGRFQTAGLVAAIAQGVVSTFAKLGVSMAGPIYFMIVLYTASTAMLLGIESIRCGFGRTLRAYRDAARGTLPISGLNSIAIVTFIVGLSLAPVTHLSILYRTSLIFGFILSIFLLKEHTGWRPKAAGAVFILIGSVLIALSGTR